MSRDLAIEKIATVVTAARFLRWNDSDEHVAELRKMSDDACRELGLDKRKDTGEIEQIIATRVAELRALSYPKYLKTFHWKFVRAWALELADERCQICNSTHSLHVHHRSYESLGDESPWDVVVLCADCHKLFHEHGRLKR